MPSTPGTPLLAIPLHLLEGICEQVALCDYDRSSLFSLSLANKACCSAARRERFKCLSITVRSAEQLESDVEKSIQVLQKNNSTQYLRILKVRGRGYLSEERAALDAQANHHPFLPRHRPPEQKDWDEHKEKELLSVAQQGFFDPRALGDSKRGLSPKMKPKYGSTTNVGHHWQSLSRPSGILKTSYSIMEVSSRDACCSPYTNITPVAGFICIPFK